MLVTLNDDFLFFFDDSFKDTGIIALGKLILTMINGIGNHVLINKNRFEHFKKCPN